MLWLLVAVILFCFLFSKFFLCFLQDDPGSVRLRFGDGTVLAVPVFGSGGSSAKNGFLCFSTV